MENLPKYALIGNTIMKLYTRESSCSSLVAPFYHRDAGFWSIAVRKNDSGEWRTIIDDYYDSLNNLPIIEVSENEWLEDNQGYI